MTTTAYHRPTRFEIHEIKQLADGLELKCSARDVEPTLGANGQLEAPLVPLLKIADEALTEKEWAVIVEAFTILESAAAVVYDAWAASPGRSRELIANAMEAEVTLARAKEEAAKVSEEIQARRAEAEKVAIEVATARAQAEQYTEAAVSVRAQVDAVVEKANRELEAKQAEAEKVAADLEAKRVEAAELDKAIASKRAAALAERAGKVDE